MPLRRKVAVLGILLVGTMSVYSACKFWRLFVNMDVGLLPAVSLAWRSLA